MPGRLNKMVVGLKPRNIWLWLKDAYHITTLIDWHQHGLISSYCSWVLRAIQPPLPWSPSFFPSHYHSSSDACVPGWVNRLLWPAFPLRPLQSGASPFLCLSSPRPHTLSLRFLFSFPPIAVFSCSRHGRHPPGQVSLGSHPVSLSRHSLHCP